MAKLSHNLEYLLVRVGSLLTNLMSARTTDRTAVAVGRFGYRAFSSRRRIATDNLTRALGQEYSSDEIDAISKRVFENTCRTLLEVSRSDKLSKKYLGRVVSGDSVEHVRKACKNGRGGIILTAHFGNWELLGAWLVAQGLGVDFVVGTQHNEKVNSILIEQRRRLGAGIIALPKNTRQIFKSIRAGRLPAMLADQHAPNGMILDFFGRPAATAKGVALFAVRANCPVFPFLMRRERFDRHIVMAGEPIYPPQTGDEEADIHSMTILHTQFVEGAIRQYPDQWLWTHRRWKVPEDSLQPA